MQTEFNNILLLNTLINILKMMKSSSHNNKLNKSSLKEISYLLKQMYYVKISF